MYICYKLNTLDARFVVFLVSSLLKITFCNQKLPSCWQVWVLQRHQIFCFGSQAEKVLEPLITTGVFRQQEPLSCSQNLISGAGTSQGCGEVVRKQNTT